MIIAVREFIQNAFSNDQALVLRKVMEEALQADEKVILDFKDIRKFTTLFFNFSTAVFITKLGPEVYRKRVELINLSVLGQSTYENSVSNAEKKYSEKEEATLFDVISNPED